MASTCDDWMATGVPEITARRTVLLGMTVAICYVIIEKAQAQTKGNWHEPRKS